MAHSPLPTGNDANADVEREAEWDRAQRANRAVCARVAFATGEGEDLVVFRALHDVGAPTSEDALAKRLDMAMRPVRFALRRLANVGLVAAIAKGARARDTMWTLRDGDGIVTFRLRAERMRLDLREHERAANEHAALHQRYLCANPRCDFATPRVFSDPLLDLVHDRCAKCKAPALPLVQDKARGQAETKALRMHNAFLATVEAVYGAAVRGEEKYNDVVMKDDVVDANAPVTQSYYPLEREDAYNDMEVEDTLPTSPVAATPSLSDEDEDEEMTPAEEECQGLSDAE
jgi:hypothetical protein